jgi:hypothetical protein
MGKSISLVILLCFGAISPAGLCSASSTQTLFADGFEPTLLACVSGTLGGATLPAPDLAGAERLACFDLVSDQPARPEARSEIARGSLPIARARALRDAELARLVVIGPGGRRWPAQFEVRSRWGRPLAETTAEIRWLATELAVEMPYAGRATLALLRLPAAPATSDPGALVVQGSGALRSIDTGAAEFTLDATRSQPITRIRVRDAGGLLHEVFASVPGSTDEGLRALVADAAGQALLEAGEHLPGSIAVTRARWEGTGPVSALLHLEGHLEGPLPVARCEGIADWPRWPFSMTLRFARGSADIDFDWQLGNSCGSPQGAPAQELVHFDAFEFRLPLARGTSPPDHYYSIDPTLPALLAGPGVPVSVEQRRGGGTPWMRQAAVVLPGSTVTREYHPQLLTALERPLGAGGGFLRALGRQPWTRYREPQAMQVEAGRIGFRLIHERIAVGKAKSLWFSGSLKLDLTSSAGSDLIPAMTAMRAAQESPLTLRPLPGDLDATGILPPLSGELDGAVGQAYRQYLERKQDDTTGDEPCPGPGGDNASQWLCAQTFGPQLWPDIQFDLQFGYQVNPSPAQNEVRLNYWDPAHIELVEFLRSGEPRWLWAFAIPQSRLMTHTAYYHFGSRRGSNIAGHSFGSGGSGDGLWHRSDSGSADYTYNRHQALAYVLRGGIAERERMAAAGHAAGLRFINDPQDNTTWAAIGRLNLQYLESLANCAQFVPGGEGLDCDSRLRATLEHLIDHSLRSGLMCELLLDAGSQCFVGQFFMLQAWYHPLLERWYRNYAHTFDPARAQAWRRALIDTPMRALAHLPRNGQTIDVNAVWPNGLACTLAGPDFTTVQSCNVVPDPDNLQQNKPAFLSLLARAQDLEPALGLCPQIRAIADALHAGPDPLGPLRAVARGGWWKGAAEAAGELVAAARGYAACGVR